jgi:NADPH:quinone reductase-like Zn-dependent oxidoreductase
MNAVRIHGYGGPEVLAYEKADRPSAGPGEVVIRIAATSVNPFDAALRAGYMTQYMTPSFPLILGTDIAGTVDAVGEGVAGLAVGDEVYARGGVYRDGAYAEYAAVAASDVARMPGSTPPTTAAALPHVSLTAWQALFELGGLTSGQTVLIHGAAGGVGHIASQLARWKGAHVIGTGSRNLDLVRELGVEDAIDYTSTRFEDVVGDVDLVIDTVGGDTQERSWSILRPGGILVSMVQPPSDERAAEHGVRAAFVASAPPIAATLTELAKLVDAGLVRPVIETVMPLSDVRQAHELIEERHTRGKIVLEV